MGDYATSFLSERLPGFDTEDTTKGILSESITAEETQLAETSI